MNFAQLLFGQVAYMVHFYADLFMEQDRVAMVSQPDFGTNFNLPTSGEAFDFIIVGGGTAGCLVANRLARANFHVLLLEAGGDPPPPTNVPGNADKWTGFEKIIFQRNSTPQYFPYSNETRIIGENTGRVLGGTSTINYMFFNRGSPHDYDNWANITGDPSWAYVNLLPHFKAVEAYQGQHGSDQHGRDGEIPIITPTWIPGADRFLTAGLELGYASNVDPNGPQRPSFTKIDMNQREGQRVSSYEAFLTRYEEELPTLEIQRYTQVRRVIFEGTRAVGVEYTRHGFPGLAYASKEVVLSAGTFGSAEILLRSGVGPAAELRALGIEPILDLPVGRNFQDHPMFPLAFQLSNPDDVYRPDNNLTLRSVHEFLNGDGGPLTSVAGLSAQAFVESSVAVAEGYPDWADLQLALYSSNRRWAGLSGLEGPAHDGLVYCMIYLGRQKSRGTVRLNPNSNSGLPLIDMNWFAAHADMDMFLEGIHMTLQVFENTSAYAGGGARYPDIPVERCKQLQFRSVEYWKCYASHMVDSGAHPTSTCSMGRVGYTNPRPVVDSKLKVIGAQGLRVIDASVMPVITNANIQAAVYVIAEKGAAEILGAHETPPAPSTSSRKSVLPTLVVLMYSLYVTFIHNF